ncbi:hypothetical protein GCM10022254_75000 [Actinomadura meridiana]|uniref:Uncharacterized protein n=1 Tax=Actinomadura meridiana TaxID=559626 RepID=A0ABP8CSA0_9ACTN
MRAMFGVLVQSLAWDEGWSAGNFRRSKNDIGPAEHGAWRPLCARWCEMRFLFVNAVTVVPLTFQMVSSRSGAE